MLLKFLFLSNLYKCVCIECNLFILVLDSSVDKERRNKLLLLPLAISVSIFSTIIVSALWFIIKNWRKNGGKDICSSTFMRFHAISEPWFPWIST